MICRHLITARIVIALLLPVASLWSQVITGSVVGTVADNTGAGIPNVQMKLTLVATGATRQISSDHVGNFVFSSVLPGSYTLAIEHPGFKKYEQINVNLSSNERLSLGEVRLELGLLSESVTVTAQSASVQTATAERSGTVNSSQVANLTVINREFTVLATLMPGVVANIRSETQGSGASAIFYVQGSRGNSNSTLIDGLPVQDLNNGQGVFAFLSIDSVSEVKVLTSSLQAEFGRTSGVNIQAVTKAGTREFHGGLYWYKRHEMFNANSFFNNRGGLPEARYRFTTAGGNIGGPIYIPGKFNRDRNKLFVFFSEEELREMRPQPIRQVTMPTQLERAGNFTDSRDLNGALIVIRDPLSGQAFPGNVIPASRINVLGQRYLNLLPLPNFLDVGISARRYNYQAQESTDVPKHNQVVRVDYNIGSKTSAYGRFNNWWDEPRGWAVGGGSSNWGWLPSKYVNNARSGVLTATHILSPSAVLEVSAGLQRQSENGPPLNQADVDRINRVKSGVTIPQFNPANNPLNLVPQSSFGGVTNPAAVTYDARFPLRGRDTLFTWSGTLSKNYAQHSLKAGIQAERARDYEGNSGVFAGNFNFGRDVNNPNDTNYAYSNAMVGNFASYTESTSRPWTQARSTIIEWYVQDNWKVTRKLTLDYGIRFGWAQPWHGYRREEAAWVPGTFDPAKSVRLIEPALSGKTRVGRNPVTGEIYPALFIGAIVPGIGNVYNGTVNLLENQNYPQGMRSNTGLKAAPRFGFAYDPSGKGKTAIRGGFGVFYRQRESVLGTWSNPPMRIDPTIYYGNLDTFINSPGVLFPFATGAMTSNWPLSRVMNFNFGIQRNVGFGTVVDVSYVGSLGRHLMQTRNLNSIPFGANFRPENQDPSSPGKPLPAAFLRPYVGYNDISLLEYAGNSSYHSMQVTVNRRFAKGLQYGASWTWSKAMNYGDTDSAAVSNLISPRVWNYGLAGFDRTHALTVHWTWAVPQASRLWKNVAVKAALDGWQVSGIVNFISGAPLGIGLGFVNSVDTTGSPTDGARVNLVQNPVIPKSERTFSRNFNTEAFQAPAVGTIGNASSSLIRGPGTNNWDISLFKNILLPTDRAKLQFRCEAYNAFNHTQFNALDTATRFDAAGRQVNARFGEFTGANAARRIQLALRLSF